MPRYKLTIEYEGTRYSGWQIQNNARTVQGEIHKVCTEVLGKQPKEIYGSGRTDAGVHALAQVAHLDAETMLAPHILRYKLNDALPADIHILDLVKTHKSFHARHDAISRSYVYQISRRRTAFGKRFVWWIKDELHVPQMQQAVQLFGGMHDFRSFTRDDPDEKSTTALLEELRIEEAGSLILLRVRGSHFLWNMVRRMVGVIAAVGRQKLPLSEARSFLTETSTIPAQLTAPPSGLFLERVYYHGEKPLTTLTPMLTVV